MSAVSGPGGEPHPRRRLRRRLGVALVALGVATLLWSVLQLSSAGFGTSPTQSFAQRRSYDQVKREVHEVFPVVLVRALLGLALLAGGQYLLTRRAGEGEDARG